MLTIRWDPSAVRLVRVPPWWAVRWFGLRERWLARLSTPEEPA